jgi:hypothetical protein
MATNGINYFFCVMDDRLFNMLSKIGFLFHKIGPSANFQGVTSPYLFIIREAEKVMQINNKLLLKYLQKGFRGD